MAEEAGPPTAPAPITAHAAALQRHIVLLGLPGAGKSTIGPLVARRMGRRYVDLDDLIQSAAGKQVGRIFAEDGEAPFREMEHALGRRLLTDDRRPVVLSPGGGWVEDPANRALLGQSVLSVYLRVDPDVALARMGEAVETRPLLAGPHPLQKVRELLARRETFYLQAQHTVNNGTMSPDEAASYIVALALGR